MWAQLLVIVGYYGLAAPTFCLPFFSGDVSTLFSFFGQENQGYLSGLLKVDVVQK